MKSRTQWTPNSSKAHHFAAVVVLTMIAATTFDPRLIWDAGAEQEP